MILLLILLLSCFNATMLHYLGQNPYFYQLNSYTWESDEFRSMKLGQSIADLDTLDYEQIAALMIEHDYDLTKCQDLSYHSKLIKLHKPADYRKLTGAYQMIFKDLKYFPIPASSNAKTPVPPYEDGWMQRRTYGGERGHEGCDIMGNKCPRGFYPIISMSDGTIEKIGWLEKGGWRIGIRTPSGVYLYYAHLYKYSRNFKEGDTIKAGELLGYMGDSGYGKIKNTVGNFDVHLHLGLYIKTDHYDELSVNPYWILKHLEKNKLTYSY